jgi:adenosylcobinamide amidohydrolase
MEPGLTAPFALRCAPPFLAARFFVPQRTLGWSLLHPGFAVVRDVVWLQVRNADLTGVDPLELLRRKIAEHGLPDALAFMTARDVRRHHLSLRRVEDAQATCLTTAGLSNAERVGSRRGARPPAGTINTLVHVSQPLTEGAMIETISIVAEARTAAIIETMRVEGAPTPTGTGTDCIVVACPCDGEPTPWAGLHTAIGEAVGGAVYAATREALELWREDSPEGARSLARPYAT